MSVIESSSKKEPFKKMVMGWSLAALVSAAAGAGGIYGWTQEGKNNPALEECSALRKQVLASETDLFQSGTLGSDGGLVVRYLEIRNPDDPRLRPWGQLKNQQDRVCAEAQRQYQESSQAVARVSAIGGIMFFLGSISQVLAIRRRLGRQ